MEYTVSDGAVGNDSRDFSPYTYPGGEDGRKSSIMQRQRPCNPGDGVCKEFLVDNLVTLHMGCDMVALQECAKPEMETSTPPLLMAGLPSKLVG